MDVLDQAEVQVGPQTQVVNVDLVRAQLPKARPMLVEVWPRVQFFQQSPSYNANPTLFDAVRIMTAIDESPTVQRINVAPFQLPVTRYNARPSVRGIRFWVTAQQLSVSVVIYGAYYPSDPSCVYSLAGRLSTVPIEGPFYQAAQMLCVDDTGNNVPNSVPLPPYTTEYRAFGPPNALVEQLDFNGLPLVPGVATLFNAVQQVGAVGDWTPLHPDAMGVLLGQSTLVEAR